MHIRFYNHHIPNFQIWKVEAQMMTMIIIMFSMATTQLASSLIVNLDELPKVFSAKIGD